MIFVDKHPVFTSTYNVYMPVEQSVFNRFLIVKALVGAFSRNGEQWNFAKVRWQLEWTKGTLLGTFCQIDSRNMFSRAN